MHTINLAAEKIEIRNGTVDVLNSLPSIEITEEDAYINDFEAAVPVLTKLYAFNPEIIQSQDDREMVNDSTCESLIVVFDI